MTTDTIDPRPEVPGELSEKFSREHVAYMRGYAAALTAISDPIYRSQIEQIRHDYGYAAGDQR